MKKNVPWHIRASRAVACYMFLLRASAHPRGAFYMLLFTHTCPVTEFAVASHLIRQIPAATTFSYGTFGSKSAYP